MELDQGLQLTLVREVFFEFTPVYRSNDTVISFRKTQDMKPNFYLFMGGPVFRLMLFPTI